MIFSKRKFIKYFFLPIFCIYVLYVIIGKLKISNDGFKSLNLISELNYSSFLLNDDNNDQISNKYLDRSIISDEKNLIDVENIKNSPLIFVGGFGRSGTTLMRAILDVHPSIRCGPETKIVPTIVGFLDSYLSKKGVYSALADASISNSSIDEAARSFVYHILNKHGKSVPRLCAKDPDILYNMRLLHRLFPKAKFVYMFRDGRDAAYSFMLKTNEKISFGVFRSYLMSWNKYNTLVDRQCTTIGKEYCIRVKYEDLITNTEKVLRNVLDFLNETWTDELLHHEKHFGDEIQVANTEWSTDQIKKPINKKGLNHEWIGKIPNFNSLMVRSVAPLLDTLGYNVTLGSEYDADNIRVFNKPIKNGLDSRFKEYILNKQTNLNYRKMRRLF